MPGMSGHELARRLRARANLNSFYLVAMTGYGQTSDREMAFSAGFDYHLIKPAATERVREFFHELEGARLE